MAVLNTSKPLDLKSVMKLDSTENRRNVEHIPHLIRSESCVNFSGSTDKTGSASSKVIAHPPPPAPVNLLVNPREHEAVTTSVRAKCPTPIASRREWLILIRVSYEKHESQKTNF